MPNANVSFPLDEITEAARRAQNRLEQDRSELLDIVGVVVVNFAQLDFVAKARGGTGSDGVKWKPLKDSTIKRKNRRAKSAAGRASSASEIGVDTGLMRASVSPGHPDSPFDVGDSSVTVGYGREYAQYFDEQRPLLPEVLPTEWQEAVDGEAADWAQRIINEEMKDLK